MNDCGDLNLAEDELFGSRSVIEFNSKEFKAWYKLSGTCFDGFVVVQV